jgi:hypothetical protein
VKEEVGRKNQVGSDQEVDNDHVVEEDIDKLGGEADSNHREVDQESPKELEANDLEAERDNDVL